MVISLAVASEMGIVMFAVPSPAVTTVPPDLVIFHVALCVRTLMRHLISQNH